MRHHYLFSDYADMIQEDGSYRKNTTFDPYMGWRWPVESRVYLDMGQRVKDIPLASAGLLTDRFGIIPSHRKPSGELTSL